MSPFGIDDRNLSLLRACWRVSLSGMTEQSWTCHRCGALVGHRDMHERWHRDLEGTSQPMKGTPGKGRAIVLD